MNCKPKTNNNIIKNEILKCVLFYVTRVVDLVYVQVEPYLRSNIFSHQNFVIST